MKCINFFLLHFSTRTLIWGWLEQSWWLTGVVRFGRRAVAGAVAEWPSISRPTSHQLSAELLPATNTPACSFSSIFSWNKRFLHSFFYCCCYYHSSYYCCYHHYYCLLHLLSHHPVLICLYCQVFIFSYRLTTQSKAHLVTSPRHPPTSRIKILPMQNSWLLRH